MDIRSLTQFLEIAKQKSYTRAAEKLYLAQPTLTKSVKNLESELGVPLFQRCGQRIELTDYGRQLEQVATPLVNEFLNIPEYVKNTKSHCYGTISVAVTPMLATLYLVDFIPEFYRKYPDIGLKLVESSSYAIIDDVVNNVCDVGLCMNCKAILESDQLNVYPILNKEVVALIHDSNPLSKRESLHIRELRNEKINFYASGHAIKDEVFQRCEAEGFSPNVNFMSSSTIFLIRLTEANNGITILPKPFLRTYNSTSTKAVPFDPDFPWKCSLITRRNRYIPLSVQMFVDHVCSSFKEIE